MAGFPCLGASAVYVLHSPFVLIQVRYAQAVGALHQRGLSRKSQVSCELLLIASNMGRIVALSNSSLRMFAAFHFQ
jgi:hypothetical protein